MTTAAIAEVTAQPVVDPSGDAGCESAAGTRGRSSPSRIHASDAAFRFSEATRPAQDYHACVTPAIEGTASIRARNHGRAAQKPKSRATGTRKPGRWGSAVSSWVPLNMTGSAPGR